MIGRSMSLESMKADEKISLMTERNMKSKRMRRSMRKRLKKFRSVLNAESRGTLPKNVQRL